MIEISAYGAAILDYSPDDLPKNICETIRERTKKLYNEIGNALRKYKTSRAIRGGINVVLAGDTNVGKSSIFNYLVGSNRAIVSSIAGTTRDVVSSTMDIDGFMVNLSDTAGIRETNDTIESIGIERTKNEIENADIIIRVYTAENPNIPCCAHYICIYKDEQRNFSTAQKINNPQSTDTCPHSKQQKYAKKVANAAYPPENDLKLQFYHHQNAILNQKWTRNADILHRNEI